MLAAAHQEKRKPHYSPAQTPCYLVVLIFSVGKIDDKVAGRDRVWRQIG